jgi:WD40 repeat protein
MKAAVGKLWNAVTGPSGSTSAHVDPAQQSAAAPGTAYEDSVLPEVYVPAAPLLSIGSTRLVKLATLRGHADRVWAVAWHPSGDVLASCSGDTTIKLWSRDPAAAEAAADDASDGTSATFRNDRHWRCIGTLDGEHSRTVRALAWSPDGSRLAAACFDATVSIWRRSSAQFDMVLETVLDGHENEVKSVAWDAAGRIVASCARDKTIQLWEDDSPVPPVNVNGKAHEDDDDDGGDDVADAPDDDGDDDDVDRNYDCAAVLQGHSQDVKAVRFHPDDHRTIVSCGYDDTIKVWVEAKQRKDDWHCVQTIIAHDSTVWTIEFQPVRTPSSSSSRRKKSGESSTEPLPRLLCSAGDDGRLFLFRHADAGERGAPSALGHRWALTGGCAEGQPHGGSAVFALDWCPITALNAMGTLSVASVMVSAGGDDGLVVHEVTLNDTGDDAVAERPAQAGTAALSAAPGVMRNDRKLVVRTMHTERDAHSADVNCVRFAPLRRTAETAMHGASSESPCAPLLASCSDDGTVCIWRLLGVQNANC